MYTYASNLISEEFKSMSVNWISVFPFSTVHKKIILELKLGTVTKIFMSAEVTLFSHILASIFNR